jgi:hypothetical protein
MPNQESLRVSLAEIKKERDEIRRGWQIQTAEWAEMRLAWLKVIDQLKAEKQELLKALELIKTHYPPYSDANIIAEKAIRGEPIEI